MNNGEMHLQTMVGLYKHDLSRSARRPGPDIGTPAQFIHQTVGISLNLLINVGTAVFNFASVINNKKTAF